MSNITRHALRLLLPAGLLFCSCSSGDSFSGSYRVTDLSALEHKLKLEEDTRVDVLFTTKLRKDSSPVPLNVIVTLPPGLRYSPGSARLYSGEALTDSLRREPTEFMECEDHRSFLRFSLSENELEARGPDGDGSRQKLRIQVKARLRSQGVVQSSAGPKEPFSCATQFNGEQRESISVD